jgi:hypothetical protein
MERGGKMGAHFDVPTNGFAGRLEVIEGPTGIASGSGWSDWRRLGNVAHPPHPDTGPGRGWCRGANERAYPSRDSAVRRWYVGGPLHHLVRSPSFWLLTTAIGRT